MGLISLLKALQNGGFHSGEALALRFGVSRTAINKQIVELRRYGLDVRSVKGKGYQLSCPMVLHDAELIWSGLPSSIKKIVSAVDVIPVVSSTNSAVSEKHQLDLGHGYVCLAEYQKSGRGRLGRAWLSPFGANIYLSLGWVVPEGAAQLEGLSLVLGYKIAECFIKMGVEGVQVKWPNDVMVKGKKIAGILIESAGDLHGPSQLTIGVGVNVNMPEHEVDINRPWTDLKTELSKKKTSFELLNKNTVCRNRVAKRLITDIIEGIVGFLSDGFERYKAPWQELDLFYNQPINFFNAAGIQLTGIGKGVGPRGEYQLDVDGELQWVASGEMTTQSTQ